MQSLQINIPINKAAYFASDLHLGAPNYQASRQRERIFITWLNEIEANAAVLFLVGDIFDYWFEYKHHVPKGYVRLLGKLAQMTDNGCKIYAFTGNHDLWLKNYLTEELNIPVFQEPITCFLNEKKLFIGHGDGLGPGDYGYKFIKKIFTNPLCKFMYRQLHPDFTYRIASYLSRRSRKAQENKGEDVFKGNEQEWLYLYAQKKLETTHFDYFVFGHRHLPLNIELNKESDEGLPDKNAVQVSRYINLGDWINHFTYAKFTDKQLTLQYFKQKK